MSTWPATRIGQQPPSLQRGRLGVARLALCSAKTRSVVKLPPSPGDSRDANRQARTFSRRGNRRVACAYGHWPEDSPGSVPEFQDLTRSGACLGCNGGPNLMTVILRWRSLSGIKKSKHSRRNVPPNLSHTEFAMGARTGVRRTRTPRSVTPLCSCFEKMLSRSWIKNGYGWSPGSASRNCCNVHSAVGWAVTFWWSIRRLPSSMITSP